LWHSEEVNPPPVTKSPKQVKVIEALSSKNIIPKKPEFKSKVPALAINYASIYNPNIDTI